MFGREGYEDSKWADVAESVGIGSTALYHYFESKLHCLYETERRRARAEAERLERITGEPRSSRTRFVAVLTEAFDLSEREIQARPLVSEQVLVGVHRTSAREEEARQLARERNPRPRVQGPRS